MNNEGGGNVGVYGDLMGLASVACWIIVILITFVGMKCGLESKKYDAKIQKLDSVNWEQSKKINNNKKVKTWK